jgi:hypothetical protein
MALRERLILLTFMAQFERALLRVPGKRGTAAMARLKRLQKALLAMVSLPLVGPY